MNKLNVFVSSHPETNNEDGTRMFYVVKNAPHYAGAKFDQPAVLDLELDTSGLPYTDLTVGGWASNDAFKENDERTNQA